MGEEHAIGELVGRITLETQMMGADASGEEIHPMVVVIERGCEERIGDRLPPVLPTIEDIVVVILIAARDLIIDIIGMIPIHGS